MKSLSMIFTRKRGASLVLFEKGILHVYRYYSRVTNSDSNPDIGHEIHFFITHMKLDCASASFRTTQIPE